MANVTDDLGAAQRVNHDEEGTDCDHAAVGEAEGKSDQARIRICNKETRIQTKHTAAERTED